MSPELRILNPPTERWTDAEAESTVAITPREPHAPRPHASGRPLASDASPTGRRRPVPVVLVLLLALVGAAGLGIMGQATGERMFRGSWEFSRLGGPWLIAGFAGGAVGGWRRRGSGLLLGAVAGAVIVGAGSVAYYLLSYSAGENGARQAATLGIGWGTAGLAVGGILGLLGAAYSTSLARRERPGGGRPAASWLHGAALGTLGGLLIGEAVALLWVWDGPSLRAMALLEGVGGVALVIAGSLGRSWRFVAGAMVFAALSAVVAPAATTLLRESLRMIGWAGA
ncbi:MAG: hypothetical protein JHD16_13325 [Solirubrobacteraceae bacterium]|nr:hypothetical protein [Solirubrobacteraceae bacterium]